jgi:phospho-N-acetylmuramoyl-pentapeptide-transferase
MILYLSLLLFSFVANSLLIVPFIDLLYKVKFYRRRQITKDFLEKRAKIFDKLHRKKAGTPVGGGILILTTLIFFYAMLVPGLKIAGVEISSCYPIGQELNVIFFTFVSFGMLGLYDDLMKFFNVRKTGFFGLRMRHKFFFQIALGIVTGLLLYVNLGIDFINIPFYGLVKLGWAYVPLAALIIVTFANAFNITDGLDGLSSGLLMIFLFAFWIISFNQLDTLLSVLISLWIGAVLAFLYFNTYPARIMLGDVGALAFGAGMAVIGLLTGKIVAFLIIGAPFLIELTTSFLQILSKKFRKKKLFAIAPFHLWLQNKGWEEPKIVMRAWLAGIIFAVLGLWLSQL